MNATFPSDANLNSGSGPAKLLRAASRRIHRYLAHIAHKYQHIPLVGVVLRAASRHWATGWLICMTAVAAGLSWLATWSVGLTSAAPAAVAAVLTVALSVHQSVRAGASLLAATIVALLLAFGVYHLWGMHAWTAAVVTVVSLTVGRLMRLGADRALQVPATALFVYAMGESLTNGVIVDRMVATIVGVGVGLAISTVAHPESVEGKIAEQMWELEERAGGLLVDMGAGVAGSLDSQRCRDWLIEARRLALDVRRLGEELADLPTGTRNSGGSRTQQLRTRFEHVTQSSDHVNVIARGLYEATQSARTVALPSSVGPLLQSTGHAVHHGGPSRYPDRWADLFSDAQTSLRTASRDVKNLDDTAALVLSGAVLSEVDQLLNARRYRVGGAEPSDLGQGFPPQ